MKKKKIKRLCTGMTLNEFKRVTQAVEEGKKEAGRHRLRRCYLCKRPEGATSVVVAPDGAYFSSKIEPHRMERRVGGDLVFEYFLCMECTVLLGLEIKLTFPDKAKKPPLPKGFPAGSAGDFYS